MKPQLSGNMLPNINTCVNGCWYFSKNLRIVALKFLGVNSICITKSINLLKFCMVLGVRCDVEF